MSVPDPRLTEEFRKGGWLPASQEVLDKWLKGKLEQARRSRAPLLPPIQDLKTMIEDDGDMYMGFNRMFENGTVVSGSFPCHPQRRTHLPFR